MSKWFNIIVFVFLVNVAVGMLSSIGVDTGTLGGGDYKERVDTLEGQIEQQVSSSAVESEANWFEKIVDMMSFGIYSKVKGFVKDYLLGTVTLLENMGIVEHGSGVSKALNSVMILIYILGIFSLFTGKIHKMTG